MISKAVEVFAFWIISWKPLPSSRMEANLLQFYVLPVQFSRMLVYLQGILRNVYLSAGWPSCGTWYAQKDMCCFKQPQTHGTFIDGNRSPPSCYQVPWTVYLYRLFNVSSFCLYVFSSNCIVLNFSSLMHPCMPKFILSCLTQFLILLDQSFI